MPNIYPKTIALLCRTAVGLALLIGAGGLTAYLVATKPQVSKSGLDTQLVRVQVVRVEPINVARQWRGYGTTQAKDTADIPARIGATVVQIPDTIEAGRVVTKGQVIAKLDATDFRNVLDAAEKRIAEADALTTQLTVEQKRLEDLRILEVNDVQLARKEFERQVKRQETGSTTPTDVDRAQRTLIAAERALLSTDQRLDAIAPRLAQIEASKGVATADRDTAKANLQRAVITSPIDGVIESLDIEVGENLAPGARVARVVDPRVIELPIQLPASARSFVTKGNAITIRTRGMPDDCPPWSAQVARIGVVDTPTRTFTVFTEIDQSHIPLRNFAEGGGPHKLPTGAFTLAHLDTDDAQPRIILPVRAIQEGRIRTVQDASVVGRGVVVDFELEGEFKRFGLPDTQWVVLKDELQPGELVVLSASMTVLDGQPVEPVIANDGHMLDNAQAGSPR